MTHRLSHVIAEDGPGCEAAVLTTVTEAPGCGQAGGDASASLASPLFFFFFPG